MDDKGQTPGHPARDVLGRRLQVFDQGDDVELLFRAPNQVSRRDALQLNNISAEPVLITRSSVTPHSAARSQPMYCHSS
jgi:hypothetical protein